MAMTEKEQKGCLKSSVTLVQAVALTPCWGYLWYRLFSLTQATSGDYAVLFVYIGLSAVFVIVGAVVQTITQE